MPYTVTTDSKGYYHIADGFGQPLGKMHIHTWLPAKARIHAISGLMYDIRSAGFWLIHKTVTCLGAPVAEIKNRMARGYELQFHTGQNFLFHRKSFWGTGKLVLTNHDGQELGTASSYFNWRKFRFEYEMDIPQLYAEADIRTILPFLLVYCMRLSRSRHSAG
jgi:hypothetical protein